MNENLHGHHELNSLASEYRKYIKAIENDYCSQGIHAKVRHVRKISELPASMAVTSVVRCTGAWQTEDLVSPLD